MKRHSLKLLPQILLLAAACSAHETAPSEVDPTEAKHSAPKAEPAKSPEFTGVISSRVSKVIASDFDAKVKVLRIRNGQMVRQGEIVAELDTTELETKLAAAKATLKAARSQAGGAGAALANAARQRKAMERLANLGVMSRQAVGDASAAVGTNAATVAQAAGQAENARVQIKDLENQLKLAHVPAPIDGQVAIVKAREGETTTRTSQIARVFDPNQLVIRFAVPKKHLDLIKLGTPVELATSDGRQLVPARVAVVDQTSDPTIDFTVFEAAIDPTFRTGEIRVGDNGHVRIAGAAK